MEFRHVTMLKFAFTLGILGAFGVGWFFFFGPTGLGGPAAYILVSGTSMEPNYFTGDLVITHSGPSYEPGDVVAYKVPDEDSDAAGALIIHRIVGGNGEDGYIVQGDNRNRPDSWKPNNSDIVGKEWLFLPGKAKYLEPLRDPATFAAFAAFLTGLGIVATASPVRRRRPSSGLLLTRAL